MRQGGCVAPSVVAITLLLFIFADVVEGGGSSKYQHDCRRLCQALLKKNATGTSGKVAACEDGCSAISSCLHHQHTQRGISLAIEMSKSCLKSCEISCARWYGTKSKLKPACVGGCNVHYRQDNLVTIADAQYLSQRFDVLEDEAPGVGIKEDKTHNISLNLEGNIQTNIKSQAFAGPNLQKDDISTKGGKRMEDRSITFNLTGEIDNDTVSEATLSKPGKGGGMSFGKRGRESSENTTLNIQGVVSHNGSYLDVSSVYKPITTRNLEASPETLKKEERRKKRRRRRRRKLLSKLRRKRRPRRFKAKKMQVKKEAAKKAEKIIPKEVQKLVKAPVTK